MSLRKIPRLSVAVIAAATLSSSVQASTKMPDDILRGFNFEEITPVGCKIDQYEALTRNLDTDDFSAINKNLTQAGNLECWRDLFDIYINNYLTKFQAVIAEGQNIPVAYRMYEDMKTLLQDPGIINAVDTNQYLDSLESLRAGLLVSALRGHLDSLYYLRMSKNSIDTSLEEQKIIDQIVYFIDLAEASGITVSSEKSTFLQWQLQILIGGQ